MAEDGVLLEKPEDAVEGEEAPQEVPSVFSVVTRYLVGAIEVSPPAEDGSRVMRLQSANGSAVIEANLSPQLWAFIHEKSGEVEIIAEDEQPESDDAGSSEQQS